MLRIASRVATALLFAGISQIAYAQADTAADRADARLARQDRIIAEPRLPPGMAGEGQLPPPFTFTLGVPITYNSNIDNADSDGRHDLHTNPSVTIDYAQQSGTIRLIGRIAADIDEYLEHEENGASTLAGRIGAKFVDPGLGVFTPYAHYTPVMVYGRNFEDHQLTIHSFAAGIGAKVPLGQVVVRPDLQVARREATNPLAERTQVGGSLTLLGEFVPDRLSWSLAQVVQARHYTGGANSGRDDLNFNTSASLSLALNARFSLELNMTLEHNQSDRSGKDYTSFDVGPSIVFSVPFGARAAPAAPGRGS